MTTTWVNDAFEVARKIGNGFAHIETREGQTVPDAWRQRLYDLHEELLRLRWKIRAAASAEREDDAITPANVISEALTEVGLLDPGYHEWMPARPMPTTIAEAEQQAIAIVRQAVDLRIGRYQQ